MTTIAEALSVAQGQFRDQGDDTREARRKSRLLMQHVLNVEACGLIAHEADALAPDDSAAFSQTVCRALDEPVHRILGWREFHGLKLALSPATLEPRDDTEAVLDLVLTKIRDRQCGILFADIGTGTGAIALALLTEFPNACAIATDIDEQALEVARCNAETHNLANRIEFRLGDWFDALREPVDFIISNPPYIPSATIETLHSHVREHDPHRALDGGSDGLAAYRVILTGAAEYLKAGGFLALEIGFDQAGPVSVIALANGWTVTHVSNDLNGNNRALLVLR